MAAIRGLVRRGSFPPRRLMAFLQHRAQILAVRALAEACDDPLELRRVDEAEFEGDFLGTTDLKALTQFERAHETCRVDERIGGSGVEPGETASHALDVEFAGFEIDAIDVGDLVFAAG